jgi:hypothetical protein
MSRLGHSELDYGLDALTQVGFDATAEECTAYWKLFYRDVKITEEQSNYAAAK